MLKLRFLCLLLMVPKARLAMWLLPHPNNLPFYQHFLNQSHSVTHRKCVRLMCLTFQILIEKSSYNFKESLNMGGGATLPPAKYLLTLYRPLI